MQEDEFSKFGIILIIILVLIPMAAMVYLLWELFMVGAK